MKKRTHDLFSLRFFDESRDVVRPGSVYAASAVLRVLIVATLLQTVGAMVLAVVSHPFAGVALGVAVALSVVTAGFEWRAGLKGRALNQLIPVVCVTGIFLLSWWFG